MAALDFPASPSLNQRHTENNASWEWNGSAWIRLADPGVVGAQGAQGHQGHQGQVGAQGAQGHQGVQGATGPTETIRIASAWCGFDGSGSGNINTDYNISSISEPASHKWKLTFSTSWAGGSNNEKGYCAVNATGAESNHWVTHRYRDYVQIEAGGAHAHQQSVVIFDD